MTFTYASYATYPTAAPLNYTQIQVLWTEPRSGVTVRILSNPAGPASDENDGTILYEGSTTLAGIFIDTPPVAYVGTVVNYSLFVQDLNSLWYRGGDCLTVLPLNWGYDQQLLTLPDYYLYLDSGIGGPLESFMALLGYGADVNRTWLEQLRNVANPQTVPANLLPGLAALLGMTVEVDIGYTQTRRLLGEIVHLYKTKGTEVGIAGITSGITGWGCDVTIGPNQMLLPDLVANLVDAVSLTTRIGLETTVITNEPAVNAFPIAPTDYLGSYGNGFPYVWPGELPIDVLSLPAQAWYDPTASSPAYPTLTWSTLFPPTNIAGSSQWTPTQTSQWMAQNYGIPLPAAVNAGTTGGATETVSTTTTFTLNVNHQPWGAAVWAEDEWADAVLSPPTPIPGEGLFAIAGSDPPPPTPPGPVSLPNAVQNVPYDIVLETQNATGPVTWAITDGSLPPGLQFNDDTGELSGIPLGYGAWTFTVTATETVIATVTTNQVVSASIWAWSGNVNPGPTMTMAVHFWDAYGNDLGQATTTDANVAIYDSTWTQLSVSDIAIPANAAFASIDLVATNSDPMIFPPDGILILAMPDVEVVSALDGYTNPRNIDITVHADRTNLVINPNFWTHDTSDWTADANTVLAAVQENGPVDLVDTSGYVGQVTPASGSTTPEMTVTSSVMPVTDDQIYTLSAYISPALAFSDAGDDGGSTIAITAVPYNSSGTALSPTVSTTTAISTWQQMAVTFDVANLPAGTAGVAASITWSGPTFSSQAVGAYAGVLLELADGQGQYFDGSYPDSTDYLWYSTTAPVGPSFYYDNLLSKMTRLSDVLQGLPATQYGEIDPFSITGFLPLGSTFTILTDQPTVPIIVANAPAPMTWGPGRWGVVQYETLPPTGTGWNQTEWGGSNDWGAT